MTSIEIAALIQLVVTLVITLIGYGWVRNSDRWEKERVTSRAQAIDASRTKDVRSDTEGK